MGQRVIPVAVTAEYIGGDGVTLGAAGSHSNVVIEYDFRSAGPMWEGTTKYVLWTNPQGNSTNRVDLGVDKLVDGYENVYHASPTADAMCVAGWAEMVVVGVTVETTTDEDSGETTSKETLKVKTEPSRFRVLPGSSRASDNEGVAATVADQLQTEIEAVDRRKVNKPVTPYDPNGEEGQYLVSLGDGRTKWEGINEDIIERILERHPDWITDLQDGEVSTKKIADGAVSPEKIQNSAVTTEKIKNSAVTTGKLADGAVTTQKIANGAVTRQKLASDVSNTLAQLQAESATKTELNEAVDEIHQHLTSPYNFKGAVAEADLPTASAANANDTYYLTDHKYRVTSNGESWEQSSMDEADYEDELGALRDVLLCEDDVTGYMVSLRLDIYLSVGALGTIGDNLNADGLTAQRYAAETSYIAVRNGDVVHINPASGFGMRVVSYSSVINADTNAWEISPIEALQGAYRTADVVVPYDCLIRYGIKKADDSDFTLQEALDAVVVQRSGHKADWAFTTNIVEKDFGLRNKGFYKGDDEDEMSAKTISYQTETQPIPVIPGTRYRISGTYSEYKAAISRGGYGSNGYVRLRILDAAGDVIGIKTWNFGFSGRKLFYYMTVPTRSQLPQIAQASQMVYIQDEDTCVYSRLVEGSLVWTDVGTGRVFRDVEVDYLEKQGDGTWKRYYTLRGEQMSVPIHGYARDVVLCKATERLMEWNGEDWIEVTDETAFSTDLVFPEGSAYIVINYPDRAMPDFELTTQASIDYVARQGVSDMQIKLAEQAEIKGSARKNNPKMVEEFVAVAKSYLNQYTLTPDPTFGGYESLSAGKKPYYYYDAVIGTDPVTGEDITERRYYGLIYAHHTPLDDGFGTTLFGSRDIDCSSFVGMVLRGYAFDESPYKAMQTATGGISGNEPPTESTNDVTESGGGPALDPSEAEEDNSVITPYNPYLAPANPKYAWSINPYLWESYARYRHSPKRMSALRGASQLAEWMVQRGQEIYIDSHLANIEPGDILFYTRYAYYGTPFPQYIAEKTYRHINHCAIVTEKYRTQDENGTILFDSAGHRIIRENGDIVGVEAWPGETGVTFSGELWDPLEFPYLHRYINSNSGPGSIEEDTLETAELSGDLEREMHGNNRKTLSVCCRPELGSITGPVTLDKAASVPTDEAPEGTIRFDADAIYVRTASGWKMVYLTDVPNA